jgi:hypothetical protein
MNDSAAVATTQTMIPTSDNHNFPTPWILCAIYTHKGKYNCIRAITETWGWRCDSFMAASTKKDPIWLLSTYHIKVPRNTATSGKRHNLFLDSFLIITLMNLIISVWLEMKHI